MGELVPLFDGDGKPVPKQEPKGATPGQALFAAIVDSLVAGGTAAPRKMVARVSKMGAEALLDGVDPESVLEGCLRAIRMAKPEWTVKLITEMAMVKAGMHLSPEQHRREVIAYKQDNNAPLQRLLGVMGEINKRERTLRLERSTER